MATITTSDIAGTAMMRSNPDEPRRALCPRCREPVVRLAVDGRPVLADHPELDSEEQATASGLFLAVDLNGVARPARLPAPDDALSGCAVHALHRCAS